MNDEKFPIISRELVVRVQKPDNTSANRFWRGTTPIVDSDESREERTRLAAELNALSLIAKDVPSSRMPSLRFAVANVDGTELFLASLPVVSRDSAGRATGVLVAGSCASTRVKDIMAAYEEACRTFGWSGETSVPGALEEVYSKRPKVVRWMTYSMLLVAFVIALAAIFRKCFATQ